MWHDKVLAIDPKDIDALREKAKSIYELTTNQSVAGYQKSISSYDKVLEIDPKNTDALYGKGKSLSKIGDNLNNLSKFQELIVQYDKVLAEIQNMLKL